MRFLIVFVVVLTLGLLADGVFDSAIGAWAALGAMLSLVVWRLVDITGVWPERWPDVFSQRD